MEWSSFLSPLSSLAHLFSTQPTQESLFTNAHEAVRILTQRQSDRVLREKTHALLGAHASRILDMCNNKPIALLFRQVATPSRETALFLDTAQSLGLTPLILEYHDDKFVSAHNPYKRALGKLPIYYRAGKKGVMAIRYQNICNFAAMEGKPLGKVRCLNHDKLVSVHHELLKELTGYDAESLCVDGSSWFASMKNNARAHYEGVLPLFIRDAILFENYLTVDYEKTFVQNTVIPAFASVMNRLGQKPLIVRLLPQENEQDLRWDAYPEEVQSYIPEMTKAPTE